MKSYRPLRLPSAALLLMLAACGGDNGPSGPSANFSLDGVWTFTITDAKAGTTTCAIAGQTVTFTSSGGTAGGSIATNSATTITCNINGSTQTLPLIGSGPLSSVSRTGANITFSYTTNSGTNTMTGNIATDNRMSGAATVRLLLSGTARTLTGTWLATRN